MDTFLSFRMIFLLMEVLAAVVGTFVYFDGCKISNVKNLMIFLWITLGIEILGFYPFFISQGSLCFLDNQYFSRNFWLYNIFTLAIFTFYVNFFKNQFNGLKIKKYINITLLLFLISAVTNLVFSGVFFKGYSSYSFIMGVLILLSAIFYYFYEMLQSDEILHFHNSLPFYIAVGTLVTYLCIIPIFIFSKYYSRSISPDFVNVYGVIINLANIFLYTCHIIGFIVCYRRNKSYS